MVSKIKRNYKLGIAFILGIIVSGIVVYATTIESKNVSYDNTKSGISATTMQGALDELYEKSDIRKYGNFVSAYTYNQTEGDSSYCVTGEEESCKKSTCYKDKTANSCKAGDIIKYKVNDTDIVTFHVMYDNVSTLTMQSQKNTINKTAWYAIEDDNTKGPLTILPILESATSSWSNVEDQTYTMGTTTFKTNAYTGCSTYNNCDTNTYTLDERTAKARMITLQEAASLGCTESSQSCPIWMYNYLISSTSYRGTENDTEEDYGYWTMSAYSSNSIDTRHCYFDGSVYVHYNTISSHFGARAVVVVSK